MTDGDSLQQVNLMIGAENGNKEAVLTLKVIKDMGLEALYLLDSTNALATGPHAKHATLNG